MTPSSRAYRCQHEVDNPVLQTINRNYIRLFPLLTVPIFTAILGLLIHPAFGNNELRGLLKATTLSHYVLAELST
jgi:hypothetical protein